MSRKRISRRPKENGLSYASRDRVLQELGFSSYSEYLSSDLWRKIRKRVISRYGNQCRICGFPYDNIHHLRYDWKTLSGKSLVNLVPLCRDCHKSLEFKDGKKVPMLECRNEYFAAAGDNHKAAKKMARKKWCASAPKRKKRKKKRKAAQVPLPQPVHNPVAITPERRCILLVESYKHCVDVPATAMEFVWKLINYETVVNSPQMLCSVLIEKESGKEVSTWYPHSGIYKVGSLVGKTTNMADVVRFTRGSLNASEKDPF